MPSTFQLSLHIPVVGVFGETSLTVNVRIDTSVASQTAAPASSVAAAPQAPAQSARVQSIVEVPTHPVVFITVPPGGNPAVTPVTNEGNGESATPAPAPIIATIHSVRLFQTNLPLFLQTSGAGVFDSSLSLLNGAQGPGTILTNLDNAPLPTPTQPISNRIDFLGGSGSAADNPVQDIQPAPAPLPSPAPVVPPPLPAEDTARAGAILDIFGQQDMWADQAPALAMIDQSALLDQHGDEFLTPDMVTRVAALAACMIGMPVTVPAEFRSKKQKMKGLQTRLNGR